MRSSALIQAVDHGIARRVALWQADHEGDLEIVHRRLSETLTRESPAVAGLAGQLYGEDPAAAVLLMVFRERPVPDSVITGRGLDPDAVARMAVTDPPVRIRHLAGAAVTDVDALGLIHTSIAEHMRLYRDADDDSR